MPKTSEVRATIYRLPSRISSELEPSGILDNLLDTARETMFVQCQKHQRKGCNSAVRIFHRHGSMARLLGWEGRNTSSCCVTSKFIVRSK